MQLNNNQLSKKAIEAALTNDWETAVTINEEILEKNPGDKDAKIRLGRAYIKLEKFSKAKQLFKEILDEDPINNIAIKNYKLASDKNPDNKAQAENFNSSKLLIKEPGTTTQIQLVSGRKLKEYEPGVELTIKITKNKITFFDPNSNKELGSYSEDITKSVYAAKQEGHKLTASVIRGSENSLDILLKCKYPIFKSEKQSEKPYLQKGAIDEPDIELTELEEEEHE